MSINKCSKHLLALFFYILIATTTVAYASDTQSLRQNTVSTTWCMKQIETIAKKENECGSKLSKTTADLQREKSKKDTLVEKLGILAIGSGLAFTNFNPLGCVIAGWLILFQ